MLNCKIIRFIENSLLIDSRGQAERSNRNCNAPNIIRTVSGAVNKLDTIACIAAKDRTFRTIPSLRKRQQA